MANYIVRIRLYNGDDSYDELHKYMEDAGFVRHVVAARGPTYRLPPGEYHLDAKITSAAALTRAKRAATKTGQKFEVLLSRCHEIKWFGLEEIEDLEELAASMTRLYLRMK